MRNSWIRVFCLALSVPLLCAWSPGWGVPSGCGGGFHPDSTGIAELRTANGSGLSARATIEVFPLYDGALNAGFSIKLDSTQMTIDRLRVLEGTCDAPGQMLYDSATYPNHMDCAVWPESDGSQKERKECNGGISPVSDKFVYQHLIAAGYRSGEPAMAMCGEIIPYPATLPFPW